MDISQPYGGQLDIHLPNVGKVHNCPPHIGGKVNISNIMFENLDIPRPDRRRSWIFPPPLLEGEVELGSPLPHLGGG